MHPNMAISNRLIILQQNHAMEAHQSRALLPNGALLMREHLSIEMTDIISAKSASEEAAAKGR